MKSLFFFVFLTLSFWTFPSNSKNLSCQQVYYIQKRFLKHHIQHTKLTSALRDQVLDRFIQNLDREKIYFLKSDIATIKRKNKRLFANLKKQRCHGLYYIYSIFSKRVKERMKTANQYLDSNFLFNKKLKYILDDDLKKYPSSEKEADNKIKNYIQYQTANVFSFEKDLEKDPKKAFEKSKKQVSYILNNFKKQVLSWKPKLNRKEIRDCRMKSKHSFKACRPTKWFSNYLNAYSQSLDSHSSYLDNEDLEEFYISMNLELEGIGATLSSRFGYTVVERLIEGGAASKSKKIKEKDKILAVGQNKNNMVNIFGERLEDVVSIIRGPKGTPVFLKISRKKKNEESAISIVKLIRDKVDIKEEKASISYHKVKTKNKTYKVGLIKVPTFYGSTFGKSVTRDVKKLLTKAKKQKISSLVLDLSNNRGGSLDEAVDLSGLFFAEGNVVKQSERNNSNPYQTFKDRDKRVFYKGPLVVLVNRFSASASEIVSGTLQDYNRAVIVGSDHTFGKGSVQSVEPLSLKLGALKTTVGLYFIPSGKSTQKEGVSSDIVFPSVFNIDKLGEKNLDNVLPSEQIQDFKSPAKEIFSKEKNNWKPVDKTIIEQLKKSSSQRIAKNKKFQKIKQQLKKIQNKTKSEKSISIAEILEDKEEKEKEKDITEKHLSSMEKDKKKYLARPDIQEALNVAGDLALIQKKTNTRARQDKPLI